MKKVYKYTTWVYAGNHVNGSDTIYTDETEELLINIGALTKEQVELAEEFYSTDSDSEEWNGVKKAYDTIAYLQSSLYNTEVYQTAKRGRTTYYRGTVKMNGKTIAVHIKEDEGNGFGYDLDITYKIVS